MKSDSDLDYQDDLLYCYLQEETEKQKIDNKKLKKELEKTKKTILLWVRNISLQRENMAHFTYCFKIWLFLVFRYHRTTSNRFEYLLSLVKDHIAKKERNFQKPKSTRERLSLTLHFLVTGESQQSISFPNLTGRISVEHYLRNK